MSLPRKSPLCHGCRKYLVENEKNKPLENEVTHLKSCTGCQLAKYCNQQCQIDDWKSHKACCRHYKKLSDEVKKMDEKGMLDRCILKRYGCCNLDMPIYVAKISFFVKTLSL